MKRKNLKSVAHNFCHSFQALDYMVSQYPLLIQMCSLYKDKGISGIEVDFISGLIKPNAANTNEIKQLVNDYMDFLPKLCMSQDVDPNIIRTLRVKVDVGFDSATVYKSARDERLLQINTSFECVDDMGNIYAGSIEESEVIKKQNYENC